MELLELLQVKKGMPKLYKLQAITDLDSFDEGLMLRHSDACLALLKQKIENNASSHLAITQQNIKDRATLILTLAT